MPFDLLFKELLRTFFREFLELFYPEIGIRLDFNRISFLDKELFTDLPEGSQREPDIVAQVYTLEGEPELILLHIEVQTKREPEFSYRMYEYYSMLWLRYKIPIFPAVLYLSPGAGGLTRESYHTNLFGHEILTFRYSVVCLPDLSADDYLDSDNPLGTGLSAIMRPSQFGKLAQKYRSFVKLAESPIDSARKSLLAYLIATNVILNDNDENELKQRLKHDNPVEGNSMLDIEELFREHYKSIYEERGLAKGIEQGIHEGLIQGERKILLNQICAKYNVLSEMVAAKLEQLDSEEKLAMLSNRILTANTFDELGI